MQRDGRRYDDDAVQLHDITVIIIMQYSTARADLGRRQTVGDGRKPEDKRLI